MISNILSFGNAVGEVTNKITSMFEVQARFEKDSREYRILDYRIKCGQLLQQNEIDKTKGIEAKPMPDQWYNWISNKISKGKTSAEKKRNWMNRKIVVDKKPYFMQYIYPAERTRLNEYIQKNDAKCLMRFRITLDELLNRENRSPEEQKFIDCYHKRMPVGMGPCTINRICWVIEDVFKDIKWPNKSDFDYSIMKCGVDYPDELFRKIKKIYEQYKQEMSNYMQYAKSERIQSNERQTQKYLMRESFKKKCLIECLNEEYLCDIVLDLCYSKSKSSKQFAWDICGDMFIRNLLKRRDYMISYPEMDENGDIEFGGNYFSMKTVRIETEVEEETEEVECQLF